MERKQRSMAEYKQMIAKERKEREEKKTQEAAGTASSDGGQGLDEQPHHTPSLKSLMLYNPLLSNRNFLHIIYRKRL